MKHAKPVLCMYEQNISELNEDKFFSFFSPAGRYWIKQKEGTAIVNCTTKRYHKAVLKRRIPSVMERWKAGVSSGAGQWFHPTWYSANVVILLQTWAGSWGAMLATAPPVIQSVHPRNEDSFIQRLNCIVNKTTATTTRRIHLWEDKLFALSPAWLLGSWIRAGADSMKTSKRTRGGKKRVETLGTRKGKVCGKPVHLWQWELDFQALVCPRSQEREKLPPNLLEPESRRDHSLFGEL